MGFYPPDALVHEAQRRGIEVLPPCVVAERRRVHAWSCRPVRLGLGYVNGVREARGAGGSSRSASGAAVGAGSRTSPRAAGACADTLARLAWAGACDALVDGGRRGGAAGCSGSPRRGVRRSAGAARSSRCRSRPATAPALRELGAWERMLADYGSTGVTLREHPLELMRPVARRALRLEPRPRPDARRQAGAVGGLVVARQRPATAKGVTFMLLEDEHGTINLIIPPPVFERRRATVRGEPLLVADGQARAPRGRDERGGRRASGGSSAPTCRRPRSATSSRRRAWSTRRSEARRPARGRARRARVRAAGPLNLSGHGGKDPRGHLELGRPRLRQGVVPAGDAGARPARLVRRAVRGRGGELELLRGARALDRAALGRRSRRTASPSTSRSTSCSRATRRKLESLPPDLREGVETTGARPRGARRRSSSGRWRGELVEAVEPLEEAGKLGAFLLQLTPALLAAASTRSTSSTACSRRCAPRRVAVELRNRGWVRGRARGRDAALVLRARGGVRLRRRPAGRPLPDHAARSTPSPATTSPTCACTAATPRAT